MKTLMGCLLLIVCGTANALSMQSGIYAIEDNLIKLENGRVVYVTNKQGEVLKKYLHRFVDHELDDHHNLISFQEIPRDLFPYSNKDKELLAAQTPTIVSSQEEAFDIFRQMNRRFRNNSQCYNRAHIWSYEEYERSGLISRKNFLFFTTKYIQEHRYKWWFHVAPLIKVKMKGGIKEKIFDPMFMRGPKEIHEWTRHWVKTSRICPEVQSYSQYALHQNIEDCFILKAPMFFWQPKDLESFEKTGAQKTSYFQDEVKWAYEEAFY